MFSFDLFVQHVFTATILAFQIDEHFI